MTSKKLNYRQFFLKRFVSLLIAAVLLCAAATAVLEMVMTDMVRTQGYTDTLNASNTILQNDSDSTDINVIEFVLCLGNELYTAEEIGMHKAIVVVDEETGEFVANSSIKLLAVIRNNPEDKPTMLICKDKDVIDFILEFAGRNIMFGMEEIYIREDDTFRPAKITVTELDGSTLSTVIGVIGERDFTPADKENYTFFDDVRLHIASGTFPDDELLLKLTEAATSEDAESAMNALYINRINSCYMDSSTTFSRGDRTYRMYTIVEFDFWGAWGEYMLTGYIASLVIVLIISLVSAKISHVKYSAKYENDMLRRSMVDSLAHDLKSPLMAISGYAENLATAAHPEKQQHYANAIMENAQYMNSIITSTLELSRSENLSRLSPEKIDVAALVNSLYEKYLPEAEGKGISFKAEGSCTVQGDMALTTQAIENLLTNAVKFTPENGSISVRMSNKSLTVENSCVNGDALAGLDLTAPFVKGSESRSNRTGTGMGLAIAKTACERQKFRLKLTPEQNRFTAQIIF